MPAAKPRRSQLSATAMISSAPNWPAHPPRSVSAESSGTSPSTRHSASPLFCPGTGLSAGPVRDLIGAIGRWATKARQGSASGAAKPRDHSAYVKSPPGKTEGVSARVDRARPFRNASARSRLVRIIIGDGRDAHAGGTGSHSPADFGGGANSGAGLHGGCIHVLRCPNSRSRTGPAVPDREPVSTLASV